MYCGPNSCVFNQSNADMITLSNFCLLFPTQSSIIICIFCYHLNIYSISQTCAASAYPQSPYRTNKEIIKLINQITVIQPRPVSVLWLHPMMSSKFPNELFVPRMRARERETNHAALAQTRVHDCSTNGAETKWHKSTRQSSFFSSMRA